MVSPQKWQNYFSTNEVFNVCISGNTLWAATPGGLIKYDIVTQQKYCFNKENGKLPFNNINRVINDQDGNVYLCNYTFSKYNEFFYIDLAPPDTLGNLNDVDINSKGEVWFTDLYKGIFIYDGVRWRKFNSSNSIIPGVGFHCVKHDKHGNMWVGTENGLFKYDGTNWVKYDNSNSGLPANIILDVAVDKYNNIWVTATDWTFKNEKLMKYDGINWIGFSRSNIGNISGTLFNIAADSTGNVWTCGQEDGISKYDGTSWKFFSGDYSKNINDITADNYGNIWLSTKKGLYKFKNSQAEQVYFPESTLPSNRIASISFDPFGKTWISTVLECGFLQNNLFHEINKLKYDGSIPDYYRCSTIDSLGNLWLGYLGEVLMYDGENITNYKTPDGNVYCMTTDKLGNVWVGYYGGVSKISGTNITNYNQSNAGGISFDWVKDILCSGSNDIYIASGKYGIIKYSNNRWTKITTQNSNLPSDAVYSFALSADKKLVVGTAKGLRIYYNGAFYSLANGNILNSMKINDVAIDGNGNIFALISGYGLLEYSNEVLKQYQTSNSELQYYDPFKIEVDENNNVWIATLYGLSVFNENGIVNPTPQKPQLIFPKANQKNLDKEITVRWNQFENAVSYSLQIATDSLFNNIIYMDSMVIDVTKNVNTLLNDYKYYWRVRAKTPIKYSEWSYVWNFTTAGAVGVENESTLPSQYSLSQNYPNPFNPITTIKYTIPQRSFVTMKVHDLLGKEIATLVHGEKEAGYYHVEFNGSQLASGIYFYSMHVGDYCQTKKLILLK